MATIHKQIAIDAEPSEVWEALRAWDALHIRLAPGFVTALRIDGEDRIITLFNGVTVRERLIAIDEEQRRLVWSIIDGPYSHHNGAAQVITDADNHTQFAWTADFLPHELEPRIDELMDEGINTIKRTLEAAAVRGGAQAPL